MTLNYSGVRRYLERVKIFLKISGVSSNFAGVSKKISGVRVLGVELQRGVTKV